MDAEPGTADPQDPMMPSWCSSDLGVFCCEHFLSGEPALRVVRDDDSVSLYCGGAGHGGTKPRVLCLRHVLDKDATIAGAFREHGLWEAQRQGPGAPWVIEDLPFVLADCEKRHAEHPQTFDLLPEPIRRGLSVGDFAKLIFEGPDGGERMWVCIETVRDHDYVGTLANDPVVVNLAHGDPVAFSPQHIAEVLPAEKRTLWRTYICEHVTEHGEPVLSILCDKAGELQARCGAIAGDAHPPESLVSEPWSWVVRRDPSLVPLTTELKAGVWCHRSTQGGAWEVELDVPPPDPSAVEGDRAVVAGS